MASVRCLINSISRFIHLVSSQTRKPLPIQKDYGIMVMILKQLKPVLDEVVDYKASSDNILSIDCGELDLAVNEAREFMENWCPTMSKICSVRRTEALLMKIHNSSLEICHTLLSFLQSSPPSSTLVVVQHCVQELEYVKQDLITANIEEALKIERDNVIPGVDHLMKIIESLSLTSNEEFLKESVAVEKERKNVQSNKGKGELYHIDQIVDLISRIRNCLLQVELFEPKRGIPIPSYFRCPLSLKLMLDPVIVASGQTYERASIQKWLDNGLTICPKTRQALTHTNLIPNYTVKAMVSNWCQENKVKLLRNVRPTNTMSVLSPLDHDLSHTDGFHHSLHGSNSISRSTLEVGNGFEKQNDVSSRLGREDTKGCEIQETEIFGRPSRELSYNHSRSESASSAISSIEYVPPASNEVSSTSTKHENVSNLSGETTTECPTAPSNGDLGFSLGSAGKHPKTKDVVGNGNHSYSRMPTSSLSVLGSDDLTSTSHVKKLIADLKSQSLEVQTTAAAEFRLLAKHNMENRILIGHSGAIKPLLSLLYSEVKLTQEHAVTALLNLSINDENKFMIAEAGAIEPLIHVLKSGNDGAKENSAAALFSLSNLEVYRAKIGRSGAVKSLVDLLRSGTLRGKKDAATALFSLSIFHENKARIVQAGAVKYLVELMDPVAEMVDKAVALLANLSTIEQGRTEIVRAGGIPLLVEVVESGSRRGKENAASVLMQLCLNSTKHCTLVLQEGAVPPLVGLSQSGTPRAKEKAQQLLSHFRNQREGSVGKRKS